MARLATLLAMPGADRRLLAEAGLRLLAAWVALRILPFSRMAASIVAPQGAPAGADLALVRRVRGAVEVAARNLPLSLTCLPQAFAASWMLQARGLAPRLLYGVATGKDQGFEAHAWVELNGAPVVGHRVADRFTLLATLPLDAGATS